MTRAETRQRQAKGIPALATALLDMPPAVFHATMALNPDVGHWVSQNMATLITLRAARAND